MKATIYSVMPVKTFTQTQGHSGTPDPESLKSSWKKELFLAGEMALSTQGDLSLVPQFTSGWKQRTSCSQLSSACGELWSLTLPFPVLTPHQ